MHQNIVLSYLVAREWKSECTRYKYKYKYKITMHCYTTTPGCNRLGGNNFGLECPFLKVNVAIELYVSNVYAIQISNF